LFDSILADPATPVGRLNLLSDDERRRLVGGCHTAAEYPHDETAVHLIDRQTARTPAAVAVEDGVERWVAVSVGPYGAALADGSEYRGRYGVGHDHLVGFVSNGRGLLAGLLGIWKAGAAYVPLIPAFRRRLAMILRTAARKSW
jgi:non-ribosomal peptide synthetase component F